MRALITGITGFAGSHLAEYILAEQPGVEVFGTFRWRSRMDNVEHLDRKVHLVEADLRDYTSMHRALEITRPDRFYTRSLLRAYMRTIVPFAARFVARDREMPTLMRYYWDTIEACAPPGAILSALNSAGFTDVERRVEMGIFSEYCACKP